MVSDLEHMGGTGDHSAESAQGTIDRLMGEVHAAYGESDAQRAQLGFNRPAGQTIQEQRDRVHIDTDERIRGICDEMDRALEALFAEPVKVTGRFFLHEGEGEHILDFDSDTVTLSGSLMGGSATIPTLFHRTESGEYYALWTEVSIDQAEVGSGA